MTIGACATAGGIQALRNFRDHAEMMRTVYAKPEYIDTLATSTAIAAHVNVDFELRGCPIDKRQLLEVIGAMLLAQTRRPLALDMHGVQGARHRLRDGCARRALPRPRDARGVRRALPLLRARLLRVLRTERRAIHEAARGAARVLGAEPSAIRRLFSTFNAAAAPFAEEAERHDE